MSGTRRRIITEDPNWSLKLVPFLSNLCLQAIMENIEIRPLYEVLSQSEQNFIQDKLTLHTPLTVTANLIPDGVYWQRRCKELWDNCNVLNHGQSWKRMFFECYLKNLIEAFLPGKTELKTILEMLPLCKDYVKKLDINQLLLPIQTVRKEGKLKKAVEEGAKPPVNHFDFSILLENLTNLEELHLWYRVKMCGVNYQREMFQMTRRDCETLAQGVKSCQTLKVLDLYQSNIDDTQCRLLVKHLLDHPSLTELDFSYNYIQDRGATAIGKLLSRSKLRVLTLSFNKIQDRGAKAIAHALSGTSTLEELNLGMNRVGDEGGQAIARALLKNSTLKTLDLSANDVAEQTAITLSNVLVHNHTLCSINLFYDKLGEKGGKALREAMSKNSTVINFVLDLTDMEEDDIDFIKEVVWANEERASHGQIQHP